MPIFFCYCCVFAYKFTRTQCIIALTSFSPNAALRTHTSTSKKRCIKNNTILSLLQEKRRSSWCFWERANAPADGTQPSQSVQWLRSSRGGVSGWHRGGLEAACYRPDPKPHSIQTDTQRTGGQIYIDTLIWTSFTERADYRVRDHRKHRLSQLLTAPLRVKVRGGTLSHRFGVCRLQPRVSHNHTGPRLWW